MHPMNLLRERLRADIWGICSFRPQRKLRTTFASRRAHGTNTRNQPRHFWLKNAIKRAIFLYRKNNYSARKQEITCWRSRKIARVFQSFPCFPS